MPELAAPASSVRTFCTFRAQERLYGVDIAQVREISTQVALTPVPQAPPLVRGLANLRSRIFLVLDLRPAVGLAPADCTPASRLVVLPAQVAEAVGVLVDAVGDIVRVPSDRIEETARPAAESGAAASERSASPVIGVCRLDTELMMIIDPARIIAALDRAIREPMAPPDAAEHETHREALP